MEVYEFEKCLLTRLEESMEVLQWKDNPKSASQIQEEWAYYMEIQIEPTGWEALWKIPRVICEELNLRYPTVVYGAVEQVLFKELKAIFIVIAVQDDDVQIPEKQSVNLIDLWPTKAQEYPEQNVERTADRIDRLRFFYKHVWMPWDNDNDDDLDWVEKHLESRIRFCYDLKRKDMKSSLAAHIRILLVEAQYIQQRREYLEDGLSDDEGLNETCDKSDITDLMRLHLRLTMIKSEIEMLENPELRKIYEEIKYFESSKDKTKTHPSIAYIVNLPFTFSEQIKYLEIVKQSISEDQLVQLCPSLQDVLNISNPSDKIFLSRGKHSIKFLEYLNDNGSIEGLVESPVKFSHLDKIYTKEIGPTDITIMSPDDDSILLVFDGNFTLKNLTLDCRNVRTGILVKNGTLNLQNCRIIGNGKSSTTKGIVSSGQSKIILECCVVQDIATGIILNENSEVALTNTVIHQTGIGIELTDGCKVTLDNSFISNCCHFGVYYVTNLLSNKIEEKKLKLDQLADLNEYLCESCPLNGDCIFEECKKGNILVLNQKLSKFPELIECELLVDELADHSKFNGKTEEGGNYQICLIDDSVIEIDSDSDSECIDSGTLSSSTE